MLFLEKLSSMISSAQRNIAVAVVVLFALASLLHSQREYLQTNVQQLLLGAKGSYNEEHHHEQASGSGQNRTTFVPPSDAPTFYEIGMKHGTDKVGGHTYHHLYTKYLESLRYKPLKFLEIGLGCNMGYGPGASYHLWLDYFPFVDLHFIEFDGDCVEKWAPLFPDAKIYAGDQADTAFLQKVMTQSGGNFDVIVDDGGHTMRQQMVSLDFLFSFVKDNGLYFIEDLATSWSTDYGGHIDQTQPDTTVGYIASGIAMMHAQQKVAPFDRITNIDCMLEICVLTKSDESGEQQYPYVGPL